MIELSIERFPSQHRHCISCNSTKNLRVVPDSKRTQVLKRARLYIPADSRICPQHYDMHSYDSPHPIHLYSAAQVEDMVDLLRNDHKEKPFKESQYRNETGLRKEQFDELLAMIPSILLTAKTQESAECQLYMFLLRLRKGISYEDIGSRFGISRVSASNQIATVRKALTNEFVPSHLGFGSIDRKYLQDHTTAIARALYCQHNPDAVVVVADGTYLYCDKSENYEFQKSTYNPQKKANFIKPMMFVTTDGKIIDIFGPYKAVENDALITKTVMDLHKDKIKKVLRDGDVFLVDRGFRDCMQLLTGEGYNVRMPEFIHKDDKTGQLTTGKANTSRLVTKCRYVVEAVNGHMKSVWQIFNRNWSTGNLLHIRDDFRIGAALLNKFYNIIVADKDDVEVAAKMLNQVDAPNRLIHIVDLNSFQKHINSFVPVDDAFVFPRMHESQLKTISQGVYQLKQGKSYAAQHVRSSGNGTFRCLYCPSSVLQKFFKTLIDEYQIIQPTLVFTRILSRFRSKVFHDIYILADANKNGPGAINAFYCGCRHGQRTVGCCSHVMSVLFFLCCARHHGGVTEVAQYLRNFFENNR